MSLCLKRMRAIFFCSMCLIFIFISIILNVNVKFLEQTGVTIYLKQMSKCLNFRLPKFLPWSGDKEKQM